MFIIHAQRISTCCQSGNYNIIYQDIRVYRAGSSDSDQVEGCWMFYKFSRVQINIDQRIELVNDNIDIVSAYPCGDNCDFLFIKPTGMRDEFPFFFDHINLVEET